MEAWKQAADLGIGAGESTFPVDLDARARGGEIVVRARVRFEIQVIAEGDEVIGIHDGAGVVLVLRNNSVAPLPAGRCRTGRKPGAIADKEQNNGGKEKQDGPDDLAED